MKSKEALERLKDDIEINYLSTKHNNEKDKSNYLILLNTIEKDLELLDIIKFLIKKGDIVVNSDLFVDYPELYEWLEQNEWNINKSNKFNQCYKVIN